MSDVQTVVAGLKRVEAGQQRLSQQLHEIGELLRLLVAQGEAEARRRRRVAHATLAGPEGG